MNDTLIVLIVTTYNNQEFKMEKVFERLIVQI